MYFSITGNQGGSCDDYYVLNDPKRNSEYVGFDWSCDAYDIVGQYWYRFAEPAGTTIPDKPVESNHCNTVNPGWLSGQHPTTPGQTINGKICFNIGDGHTCYKETQIKIKHCTSYYLYFLSPRAIYCPYKYCSTSTTLISNLKTLELSAH